MRARVELDSVELEHLVFLLTRVDVPFGVPFGGIHEAGLCTKLTLALARLGAPLPSLAASEAKLGTQVESQLHEFVGPRPEVKGELYDLCVTGRRLHVDHARPDWADWWLHSNGCLDAPGYVPLGGHKSYASGNVVQLFALGNR